MTTDYIYCKVESECIHRRGCKRWVGNYKDEDMKELNDSNRAYYLKPEACIESQPYPFTLLDRFRFSNGEDFE